VNTWGCTSCDTLDLYKITLNYITDFSGLLSVSIFIEHCIYQCQWEVLGFHQTPALVLTVTHLPGMLYSEVCDGCLQGVGRQHAYSNAGHLQVVDERAVTEGTRFHVM